MEQRKTATIGHCLKKKLAPLGATIGEAPQPVAKIDEYVLVSNR